MVQDQSAASIGQRLFLSPKTVETYVRGIFTKLNLDEDAEHNRRVLAVLAYLNAD